jgi:hypothetical protein
MYSSNVSSSEQLKITSDKTSLFRKFLYMLIIYVLTAPCKLYKENILHGIVFILLWYLTYKYV